jgi:hypothetical protein
MADIAVQASFNSGEWSPNLYSRVDMQKYRSGAALLENFFVDYRGGASTRVGTKYVIQALGSANPVRLIPFQASFSAGYIIEIGNGYMRFIYDGAPIVESSFAITAATNANPCVITVTGNNYNIGDWVFVTGVAGMTQINGRYFQVLGVSGASVTLGYLNGTNLDSTSFGTYTSGGTVARIYTISSPYTASDNLEQIKFAQAVNQLYICHPNYPVYILTLIAANNWSLAQMVVGATVQPPTSLSVTTTITGSGWNYAYGVTSIDSSGQESSMSSYGTLTAKDLKANAGTNTITWSAAPGAVAYNVYEAVYSAAGAVPAGANFGFIGTTKATSFADSNISPDFTESPPIAQNPFNGQPIASVAVGVAGSYATGSTVPIINISGGTPLISAILLAQFAITGLSVGTPSISNQNWAVGDVVVLPYGIVISVTAVGGGYSGITAFNITNYGTFSGVTFPGVLSGYVSALRGGVPYTGGTLYSRGGSYNITVSAWTASNVQVISGGAYVSTPTLSYSSGSATATATLGPASGNPQVPGFVQQRLVLAGVLNYPATFYMSQPGQYTNFNISDPVVGSDAVTGTLVSGTLQTIKSVVGSFAGMIILTDNSTWVVNGGGPGTTITPSSAVANIHSYVGANDVPPIVANYHILFVQNKGSAVRDLAYNYYFQVFTGTDISVISSHLFYGYTIDEWAWAEQPFYLVQAIRSDGVMLSLTFQKEQEFVGWSHYVTNGSFNSVASVIETLSNGTAVDAVYTVVQRTINGATVQYIERFAERQFTTSGSNAWCVDAGTQYTGPGSLSFSGGEQLAAATVTGLATDNLGNVSVITPFIMPSTGLFTLPAPTTGATNYTTVTVGLAFTCKLQTLPLDVGEPSVQGKVKKIQAVDIRVKDTLGLQIGSSFSTLVTMKDLVLGNVSSALTGQPSQIVTGLVTGDAKTHLDPTYTVPGQYCIQQALPWPATVLGCFPVFDSEDRR